MQKKKKFVQASSHLFIYTLYMYIYSCTVIRVEKYCMHGLGGVSHRKGGEAVHKRFLIKEHKKREKGKKGKSLKEKGEKKEKYTQY